MSIRILIADDEQLTLRALSDLLSMQDDLEIVAEAGDSLEALELAERLVPDICLLDLIKPGSDGVSVTESLRQTQPDIRCIIITPNAQHGELKQALTAGASAYVSKITSASDLAKIVRLVHEGNRFIDLNSMTDALSVEESPLTSREAHLLALAADQVPFEKLVQLTNMPPRMAREHLSHIAAKLKAADLREATYIARQHGWI
ncbi:response regulator transcription factor [Streptomyces sp. NPDC049936]|uniref:response regulator transcription factor n=1 Tax=Streptomyces sp. NPDC049936 TaxID=3365599 RepID=UPI00379EEF7A